MRAGGWDQDRVIVGVDGSLASLAALREAVEQARCRRVELRVIHVRQAVRTPRTPTAYGTTGSWTPSAEARAAETRTADYAALDLIETCLQRALGEVPTDVSIDPVVAVGKPAEELCRLAWREGDLLVIGTSGGRRWSRPAHRSVRRYCLNHARCTVLVVPRSRFARIACSRSVTDRPRLPHDLWREFDSTGGESHELAR